MLGYAEQLEWLATRSDSELIPFGGRPQIEECFLRAARATCDFYIEQTPTCGVPYWDTGAPGLSSLGDYLAVPADPFNACEPVDSSAAAIAAQGLLRLGRLLDQRGDTAQNDARRYVQAALTVANTILDEPYLATDANHDGLLLHAVYHRPQGWDHIPVGQAVPCGEACMWGDYHARELAVMIGRMADDATPHTFFGPCGRTSDEGGIAS